MRLYFLRHGNAASQQEWSGDDALRPLTDKGRKVLEEVATFLADQRLAIDLVVTSPFLRASQTAQLVAKRLGLADRLETDERLTLGFGPAALGELLLSHADLGAIMLVGHEPTFSETIGALIGGGRVECKKASVACVNVPDIAMMKGELEWLLPPRLLNP
ncbi:MAG: phosphohistidine phosphatase SixA [Acidobacteria bacterium]|nr:phosphohistidine phosphatase SixA [Acidobacteriota bacterium]